MLKILCISLLPFAVGAEIADNLRYRPYAHHKCGGIPPSIPNLCTRMNCVVLSVIPVCLVPEKECPVSIE